MEDICKSIVEKISSYNIFNNLLPGIVFCYLVESTTRISFVNDLRIWEMFFVYYFIGMIISRIGSLILEKILKNIKVKNKETKAKEKFIVFASYDKYSEAAENKPFITQLSENNNAYRTIATVFALAGLVKIYDCLVYDIIIKLNAKFNSIIIILGFIGLMILFIMSYKKQTEYICKQVERYTAEKEEGDKN